MAISRKDSGNFETLDLGCGGGLFEANPHGQVNLDICKPNKPISNFILGDGHYLPLRENKFRKVVCIEVIEHVDSPIGLIKECHRVLRKNGTLILSTPNAYHATKLVRSLLRKTYGEHQDHICSYTYITLKQLVEKVFKKAQVEFVTMERKDGKKPHGWVYVWLCKVIIFPIFRARHLIVKAKKSELYA